MGVGLRERFCTRQSTEQLRNQSPSITDYNIDWTEAMQEGGPLADPTNEEADKWLTHHYKFPPSLYISHLLCFPCLVRCRCSHLNPSHSSCLLLSTSHFLRLRCEELVLTQSFRLCYRVPGRVIARLLQLPRP
jgi:hypothetical protein